MDNQFLNEVFTLQHRQKMIREAQTSRPINELQKTDSKKFPGASSIISRLRNYFGSKNFGYQIRATDEARHEKELISG